MENVEPNRRSYVSRSKNRKERSRHRDESRRRRSSRETLLLPGSRENEEEIALREMRENRLCRQSRETGPHQVPPGEREVDLHACIRELSVQNARLDENNAHLRNQMEFAAANWIGTYSMNSPREEHPPARSPTRVSFASPRSRSPENDERTDTSSMKDGRLRQRRNSGGNGSLLNDTPHMSASEEETPSAFVQEWLDACAAAKEAAENERHARKIASQAVSELRRVKESFAQKESQYIEASQRIQRLENDVVKLTEERNALLSRESMTKEQRERRLAEGRNVQKREQYTQAGSDAERLSRENDVNELEKRNADMTEKVAMLEQRSLQLEHDLQCSRDSTTQRENLERELRANVSDAKSIAERRASEAEKLHAHLRSACSEMEAVLGFAQLCNQDMETSTCPEIPAQFVRASENRQPPVCDANLIDSPLQQATTMIAGCTSGTGETIRGKLSCGVARLFSEIAHLCKRKKKFLAVERLLRAEIENLQLQLNWFFDLVRFVGGVEWALVEQYGTTQLESLPTSTPQGQWLQFLLRKLGVDEGLKKAAAEKDDALAQMRQTFVEKRREFEDLEKVNVRLTATQARLVEHNDRAKENLNALNEIARTKSEEIEKVKRVVAQLEGKLQALLRMEYEYGKKSEASSDFANRRKGRRT